MKKILVTGGAGFIGSNLCDHLVKKGYYVVCLDNFSTGHMKNIQHLIDDEKSTFELIEGDIRNFQTCLKAVDGAEFVFHEAALGSIPRSINDPITTNDVNIGGFLNMLVAARDSHVKRFIFAASSSAYGDSKELPKVEDHVGKPLSPYALTKYVDELYADVFAKTYGIEYIGLRYFNIFGKRQDPDSMYAAVIPLFIKQFMNHRHPIINGDGQNSRDFTYIDNVIHMNMLAMNTTSKDAINQIYNTAGGERTTINELVEQIRLIMTDFDNSIKNVEHQYGPTRSGDIPHSLASIDKAYHMMGYKPIVCFSKGLRETIKWYWNESKNSRS